MFYSPPTTILLSKTHDPIASESKLSTPSFRKMDGRPPIFPKNSWEFHYGNIRFSNEALNLICCCAFFSTIKPITVAWLFQGKLCNNHLHPQFTNNRDLSNVQASEVHGCFFKMLDNHHPIYLRWSAIHPLFDQPTINHMLRPFEDAEVRFRFDYDWDQEKKKLRSTWGRRFMQETSISPGRETD